jgi:benzoyl-CoA 2,3-dioxygenase component B
VIDLPTIQRYLNFHFSVTIDLFGADQSSNAAIFYSSGLKGRFEEGKRSDDHVLKGEHYKVLDVQDGRLVEKDVPMLNALNEVLRDDYIKDSVGGVSPEGHHISDHEWNQRVEEWLPTDEDRAFVASLMGRVVEPGRFANWIAPPMMGINRQPVDFEYVRFN